MIKLGDRVKDKVTKFAGIAIGRTEWLNGCARITVQPEKLLDGKIPDTATFDEPQLAVVSAGAINTGPRNTGGPIPAPQRRTDVRR